jgi:L-arabinose isomerase
MKDVYIDFTETRPAVKAAADGIAGILGEMGEVVCPGVLENRDDADRIRGELERAGVDVLVYVAFAYQQGAVPLRILNRMPQPAVIWNTQDLPRLPDDAGFNQMWTNSGLAGLGDICNALTRTGKRFSVITSRKDDEAGRRRLHDRCLAAAVKRRLRETRIAAVGRIYEGMMDFRVDEMRFHAEIGPTIFPVDQNLIAKAMEKVAPERIAEKLAADQARYDAGGVDEKVLEHSVQVALAMEDVVVGDYRADALAQLDQSWSFDKRVGCVPSYGYLHLNDMGVPCTCERDVLTATAMKIGEYLSGGLTALTEFFDMNFEEGSVVLCHDSNGTPALAAKPGDVRLNTVPLSLCPGDWGEGVGADLAYPPGRVTMLSLAAAREGWKMVAAVGEALEKPPRAIGAPYMVWKPDSLPLSEWCDRWLLAGPTHHMAVWYGEDTAPLASLAEMLEVDFEAV